MNSAIACWHSIDHHYGAIPALRQFSLDLRAGQITALLGPNGAGKSTAIRLLLGLVRCQRGSVQLFGLPPQQRNARLRLGAMLQRTDLPDTLSVAEHVALFAAYYARPLSVAAALAAVGLQEQADRRYSALSGGQQRRVQLALALVGQPELLVLDEPTVGMDLASRQAFRTVLRAARERGCAVLLATHDLPEVESLADRIALLEHGRLVAADTPQNIRARVDLKRIRCRSQLDPAVLRGWSEVARISTRDGRLEMLSAQPERLLRRLLEADADLAELEVRGADLEEAIGLLSPNPAARVAA